MKKIIFTFAILVSISFNETAFSQGIPSAKINENASALTREMSAKLGLNEMEYIKLKSLNRDRLMKTREINHMYSNDITMRENKMAELANNYDAELQSILSSKQMEAYADYKTSPANYTALSSEE